MKTVFSLFIAFLLAASAPVFADKSDDNMPLLTIENEEEATATPEKTDVEIFVEMNLLDKLMNIAQWELTLLNGNPLKEQPYPNTNGKWLKVPSEVIRTSKRYEGMKWFDLRIHGTQPGWFGKTRLGKFMGVNQDYFNFTQRFYVGNNKVWTTTQLMSKPGEELIKDISLEIDKDFPTIPVIWLRMFTHNETYERLIRRLLGYTQLQEAAVDSTDGDASADPGADFNTGSNSETGAAALLVMTLLANMVLDPTGASASKAASSLYEYVYDTGSVWQ